MLIVNQNDTFKVNVIYKKNPRGEIEFLEKAPEGPDGQDSANPCSSEWFEFRFPNWSDVRLIMRSATNNGSLSGDNIDAMAFMDAKIRVLLKSWSLTDENEKSLPLFSIAIF